MFDATVIKPDPHCRVWANVRVSLWGNVTWHDLDEAVRVTDTVWCRVREGDKGGLQFDRKLIFKTWDAASHVMMRLAFKRGVVREFTVPGVSNVVQGLEVEIK